MANTVVVFGHTCAGHGFTNPYVTRYPYTPLDNQPYLIDPQSSFWRQWRTTIKAPNSDMWMRFPFMYKIVLINELIMATAAAAGAQAGARNAPPRR
jgi:hypothetical protein